VLPVRRTAQADEDLIAIWQYIARDNAVAADRVLDAIEARWRQLAHHPFSGIARDDIGTGIRHLTVGRYLILYRVREAIEILRVLHGKRNLGSRDVPE